MANREVSKTGKSDGVITTLCRPGANWSPRSRSDAIWEIENGLHSYYFLLKGKEVAIHVVESESGKYLRTDPDRTTANNLLEFRDC